eukprot:6178428-Pleurochrysis_carterae.AAC.1
MSGTRTAGGRPPRTTERAACGHTGVQWSVVGCAVMSTRRLSLARARGYTVLRALARIHYSVVVRSEEIIARPATTGTKSQGNARSKARVLMISRCRRGAGGKERQCRICREELLNSI